MNQVRVIGVGNKLFALTGRPVLTETLPDGW
jgi:hypothetical protein